MKLNLMRTKTNFKHTFFNREHEVFSDQVSRDLPNQEMLEERKRLKEIFDRIDQGSKKVHIIACPSISLKREDIEKIVAIDLYVMRSLWQIL